jgi:hypothetical protein
MPETTGDNPVVPTGAVSIFVTTDLQKHSASHPGGFVCTVANMEPFPVAAVQAGSVPFDRERSTMKMS